MGDVITLPVVRIERETPKDGGKARILRRRDGFKFKWETDDLTMRHTDPEMPCDSAYCAPECDPA